ncbi:MAG: glycosyltransferase family 39 protein [Chitinophagales bacterium]|nr:glycosyltransferase family 39 protein [Chitinophagales bacterium]
MKSSIRFREKLFLVGVFLGSLFFNLKYISQHAFLHDWDERFHALVAKNLAENMLLPLLYNGSPVTVCDHTSWVCNTVWLHKQPLFLWQMALSIKVFGATEWAVRFPSALMLSLLVFPVFRIGKIMFNSQTGLLAALLTVSNWFILEHIDGQMGMDHNDVAFMFYVILSIWALMEYIQRPQWRYLILMGLFSGCAMLNKWVIGLLVFEGFFIYSLMQGVKVLPQNSLRLWLSAIIAFVLFLPWQVYCFTHFHDNAMYEWSYNQRHFWEVLEGHWHERYFYLNQLKYQFSLLQAFVFIGIILALLKIEKIKLVLPVVIMVISIYVFFTVAATKIVSYVMVTMPLLFIFMAYAFTALIDLIRTRNTGVGVLLYLLLIPLVLLQNFNLSQLQTDYNLNGRSWFQHSSYNKDQNTIAYKAIARLGLGQKIAIVGYENNAEIEGMFYTDAPCYGFYIPEKDIKAIRSQGYKIVVFKNKIPPLLQGDSSVIILPYNYL